MKNKQINTARGAALKTLDQVLQNGAYVAMIASGEHQTEIEDAWNAQFGA